MMALVSTRAQGRCPSIAGTSLSCVPHSIRSIENPKAIYIFYSYRI
jgi:hypothetical protein